MSTTRRKTSTINKAFLLTGFSDNERKIITKQITSLGGIVFDKQGFLSTCTHVICGKPSRSEKYLGACATGKWLLHPSYIVESSKRKVWQDEEAFEWSNFAVPDGSGISLELRDAPRRWRFNYQAYVSRAFSGWKVATLAGEKRNKVYRRLLRCGNATVYSLKLPVTNPVSVADTLTYLFVTEKYVSAVYKLMEYGVLCLKPEFIGDYLIKDPTPDPMDYIVVPNMSTDNNMPTETQHSGGDNGSQSDVKTMIWSDTCKQMDSPFSSQEKVFTSQSSIFCDNSSSLYTPQASCGSRSSSNASSPNKAAPNKLTKRKQTKNGALRDIKNSPLVQLRTQIKTEDVVGSCKSPVRQMSMKSFVISSPRSIDKHDVDNQNSGMIGNIIKRSNSRETITLTSLKTESNIDDNKEVVKSIPSVSIEKNDVTVKTATDLKSTDVLNIASCCKENPEISVIKKRPARKSVRKALQEKSESQVNSLDPCSSVDIETGKRKLETFDESGHLNKKIRLQPYCQQMLWHRMEGVITEKTDVIIVDEQSSARSDVFSDPMTAVIHSCLEEEEGCVGGVDFLLNALDLISSLLSKRQYPQSHTVSFLLSRILRDSCSPGVASRIFQLMMDMLSLHPPTNLLMSSFYLSCLEREEDKDSDARHWNFLKDTISSALMNPSSNDGSELNSYLVVLRIILKMVEDNFIHMLESLKHRNSTFPISKSLICQLLWPNCFGVAVNNKCSELFGFIPVCLQSEVPEEEKYEILAVLVKIISMATESCRLLEAGNFKELLALPPSLESKTNGMLMGIVSALKAVQHDQQFFVTVLSSLQPPWLVVHVCMELLKDFDDYLIMNNATDDESLNLKNIIKQFFFLLPKIRLDSTQKFNTSVNLASAKTLTPVRPTCKVDSRASDAMTKSSAKINKQNFKGETQLHVACIKNNVSKVQQLLAVPGIDVNIKDNAGWTPLHEACNHGHVECVRELLNFVPAKTMEHYMSTEHRCRKVDLMAPNFEGITPLHDAVLCNKLDVCELLLSHGGKLLLEARTIRNYTPLDLAASEDMIALLRSFEEDQTPLSQCSDMSLDLTSPSSYLYDQVIGQSDHKQTASKEECLRYLHIVSNLVAGYLRTMNNHDCYSQEEGSGNSVKLDMDDKKVLGKWSKYVSRFEKHLCKISCEKDHPALLKEIRKLRFFGY